MEEDRRHGRYGENEAAVEACFCSGLSRRAFDAFTDCRIIVDTFLFKKLNEGGRNTVAQMRLDKYLGVTGCCSRAEAKRVIRGGGVLVNGVAVSSADCKLDPERDTVMFCGRQIVYRKYYYILMNKPEGVVSATEDGRERTVLDLLPEDVRRPGLFPCGRLDKNTVGLVLITDNGPLGHRLLAPNSHVEKEYAYRSKFPVTEEEAERFRGGLVLEDGYETKSAGILLDDGGRSGRITLMEGKYHQIKRMMEALHNQITYLERVRFGPLTLQGVPNRGDWRFLTDEEIALLEAHGTTNSKKQT